jgi:DNA polymerase elongation subunit (family B)
MYISVQKWGNSVLHRYIDEHGRDCKEDVKDFRPTLYIEAPNGEFTSMLDENIRLGAVELDDFNAAKDFIDENQERGFTVYGQNQWAHNAISSLYANQVLHPQFEKTRVSMFDLEVESDDGFPSPIMAAKKILSISHYDSLDDKLYLFSLAPWSAKESFINEIYPDLMSKIIFRHCRDEKELLRQYLSFWTTNYPMVVSGWNSGGFDIPYLYNRIVFVLGEAHAKTLSPFRAVTKREYKDSYGNAAVTVNLYGIAQLDLQDLYKKFEVKPRENYRLATIATVELGTTKIDYTDEETIQNMYDVNPQKFNDYNILDSWLVWLINAKRQMIQTAMFIAYTAKVNLEDVYSPVKVWDAYICNKLLDSGRAAPLSTHSLKQPYIGAYVKQVIPGMYRWIVSFDVASMHPTIIRQWNMCASTVTNNPICEHRDYSNDLVQQTSAANTLVEACPEGFSVAANGVLFSHSKSSTIPGLVAELFNERKTTKSKALSLLKDAEKHSGSEAAALKKEASSYKTKEGAIKVLLNSLYGAMANEWFRFFDIRMAEGVTLTSQVVIQFIERRVNEFLNRVLSHLPPKDRCLAIDTDSVYFELGDLVDMSFRNKSGATTTEITDFLDKVSERITESAIIPAIEELAKYMRCRETLISMKREAISDKGFWTAKKKYALNVIDNEGVRYAEPEQKAVGLQLVQTSTPKFCRDALAEAVKIILTGDINDKERLVPLIKRIRDEYETLNVYDIACPRGVSELDKWKGLDGLPGKGAQPPIRGVLYYNHWLTKMGLDNKYQIIKPGSKIRYLHLNMPNPLKADTIAFFTRLPTEFNIEPFIDRQHMYDFSFLTPLKGITDAVGLLTEPDRSLEDFFG